MFGKLIDGRLVVAGSIVKDGNTTITNPTEQMLKDLGYKEIKYCEKPEYNEEEEKLVEGYTDNVEDEENYIFVTYTPYPLTDEEHNAIIQQKIVAEENKMTARNIRGALLNIEYDINEVTKIENNIAQLRKKLR